MAGTQLGVCSIYFSFIASNLHGCFHAAGVDNMSFSLAASLTSYNACFSYVVPVFCALSMLPSIDTIAPYTRISNVLMVLAIGCVVFFAGVWIHQHGIDWDKVQMVRWTPKTPIFFGTSVFCFSGICNLFPVENSLANPEDIWSIVQVAMVIVGTIFTLVGVVPHLAWPHNIEESVTAELDYRVGGAVASSAGFMVIVAVSLTFPVQFFPAVEVWENRMFVSVRDSSLSSEHDDDFSDDDDMSDHKPLINSFDDEREVTTKHAVASSSVHKSGAALGYRRAILRLLLVALAASVAVACPSLERLLGVLGSLGGSLLSFVIPALISFNCRPRASLAAKIADLTIITVGLIGGTWGSVVAMIP